LFRSERNDPRNHTKPHEQDQLRFVYFGGSFLLEGSNLSKSELPGKDMRRFSLPFLLLCFLLNVSVTRAQVNRRAAIDHLNRGTKELDAGDLDGALADFNRAIELDPNYSAPYFNRGLLRTRQADYDGAISDFTKAIALNPIAEAYLDRGAARKDKATVMER
jgi:tetratricopeptide (TPR) repeat protein